MFNNSVCKKYTIVLGKYTFFLLPNNEMLYVKLPLNDIITKMLKTSICAVNDTLFTLIFMHRELFTSAGEVHRPDRVVKTNVYFYFSSQNMEIFSLN